MAERTVQALIDSARETRGVDICREGRGWGGPGGGSDESLHGIARAVEVDPAPPDLQIFAARSLTTSVTVALTGGGAL
jgi:hypothetical protein